MPIRKKGDVEIQASANGAKVKQTGYTFYSYDKKSAALYFQFRGQDGQPTDLGKATIHLVMILNDDDGKEFIPKSDEIKVISAIRGTAKYVLPEMLLSYSGKVTGYVYMDFDDGSQTDEGQFTFRIRRSMITHVLPEAGDKYVQDFEDVKEHVEQAGDSATKDIKQAKDDAESQIGDYVGEVESAKQDISSSASDVQSKASEASEDISGLVKTTEDARDDAVKTMYELDYSDRNLLLNSSNLLARWHGNKGCEYNTKQVDMTEEWGTENAYEFSISGGTEPLKVFYSTTNNVSESMVFDQEYTYSVFIKNTGKNKFQFHVNGLIKTENSGNTFIQIEPGESKRLIFTGVRRDNYDFFQPKVSTCNDVDDDLKMIMAMEKIQKGNRATDWTPAPEDIVTNSELEKIKQAIINLGGSI